LCFHLSCV